MRSLATRKSYRMMLRDFSHFIDTENLDTLHDTQVDLAMVRWANARYIQGHQREAGGQVADKGNITTFCCVEGHGGIEAPIQRRTLGLRKQYREECEDMVDNSRAAGAKSVASKTSKKRPFR